MKKILVLLTMIFLLAGCGEKHSEGETFEKKGHKYVYMPMPCLLYTGNGRFVNTVTLKAVHASDCPCHSGE